MLDIKCKRRTTPLVVNGNDDKNNGSNGNGDQNNNSNNNSDADNGNYLWVNRGINWNRCRSFHCSS